VRDKAKVAIDH